MQVLSLRRTALAGRTLALRIQACSRRLDVACWQPPSSAVITLALPPRGQTQHNFCFAIPLCGNCFWTRHFPCFPGFSAVPFRRAVRIPGVVLFIGIFWVVFPGFSIWDSKGAKECKSCRSRKMLKNAPTLAIRSVDTAENEPSKVS